jgi:hypothetical protein
MSAQDNRLAAWVGFRHANAHPHDCTGPCPRCEHEDAAERVAIQTEGQAMSAEAWQRAIALLLESRRPGQRALGV